MKRLIQIQKLLEENNFYIYELDKEELKFNKKDITFSNSTFHQYKEILYITELLDELSLNYKLDDNSNILVFEY